MRALCALATFMFIMMAAQACLPKKDKSEESNEDAVSVMSEITSVIYAYSVYSSCESSSVDLLFSGDDLQHPIFASILSTAKSAFEPAAACSSLSVQSGFEDIRLRFRKSDGSQDVYVSTTIGCGRELSPDIVGIIPSDLLAQIKQALHLDSKQGFYPYQQNSIAVYYHSERVADVDPGSFEVLNGYARDKSKVYYGSKAVEGVDPGAMVVMDAGWAKDQTRVFYRGLTIEGADPNSLVQDKVNLNYVVDAQEVFFKGSVVSGVDPAGFVCIDDQFCKNASQVLFMNSLVSDVDAASFAVDSCSVEFPKPMKPMLCSPPPMGQVLVCQVHDKNRSFSLEHKK